MNTTIKRLRNRENITLFDSGTKLFHRIQLNKTTPFICWQRFVSTNRNNWVKHNECLSLKEIVQLQTQIKFNRNRIKL